MPRLPHAFYLQPDVVAVSRQLIGKRLFTQLPSPRGPAIRTGGIITETEAYAGPDDRASHAHGNRRTPRTEIMFHEGGVAYVYLCYGMHALFNIVTNVAGIPHAILVRAIEPTCGIDTMLERRHKARVDHTLTCGPGCLTQALGIDVAMNGTDLTAQRIWLEQSGRPETKTCVKAKPRVGVDYAGSHARLPWRFLLANSPWVSRS
jgi:DNA-3-methyladenine glycosylase